MVYVVITPEVKWYLLIGSVADDKKMCGKKHLEPYMRHCPGICLEGL
jgi:hypothetical protein